MTEPTLICCKTIIGKGSPNKAGTHEAHGAALGEKEVAATRAAIGWRTRRSKSRRRLRRAGTRARAARRSSANGASASAPTKQRIPRGGASSGGASAGELARRLGRTRCGALIGKVEAKAETIATRKASQNAIEGLAPVLPEFSAARPTSPARTSHWSGGSRVRDKRRQYISYGVREFGMAAIMNGIALHGGFIPYCGTFLTFSDYARNALRMAALMKLRKIFVFTHDSIGLGEDGPTHQSVEHASSLRLIPNLDVWRPCDAVEPPSPGSGAIERRDGPTALLFSRQNLQLRGSDGRDRRDPRGGYVLADSAYSAAGADDRHRLGSAAALVARKASSPRRACAVRVVSMPSTSVRPAGRGLPRESCRRHVPRRGGGGREGLLAQVRGTRGQGDRHRHDMASRRPPKPSIKTLG